MRKRERESPCFVCGHYHKYEEGEMCGVCGHRMIFATEKGPQQSAFSTEILTGFLYLGSYDNASRAELLKAQGITRILNTVPSCQNLYTTSFTYYCVKDDKALPFDECIQFIDDCRKTGERVLVHCMSGQNRSPAIVIAYLMKCKGWRLSESFQWVRDRRPSIHITEAVAHQLQEYEAAVFGSDASSTPVLTSPDGGAAFGFGYSCPPAHSSHASFGVSAPFPPSAPPTPLFQVPATIQNGSSPFVFGAGSTHVNGCSQHVAGGSEEKMDGP